MILVDEEMKHVDRWYLFHMDVANQKAASCLSQDKEGRSRGYGALLWENAKKLRFDYEQLPDAIKGRGLITGQDLL